MNRERREMAVAVRAGETAMESCLAGHVDPYLEVADGKARP